ncbi:MAG: endonuclease/exonuclease/phosphatase family protein [Eubacteriales bacterium]
MKRFFALLLFLVLLVSVSCQAIPQDGQATTEQQGSENETTKETSADNTTEETTMTRTLRIGSYNIKHGADAGLDLSKLGKVIKEQELDIVGLQEVDYKTKRSNGVDQPAKLAKAADMPYYAFIPAIDYQGGKYGTLILSKYPIISSEVIKLTSWDKEGRALGHAVIDVDGNRLDFFNTHLSYEDTSLRRIQFEELAEKINICEHFILTGDFNTADFTEFGVLGGCLINNDLRHYPTFESGSAIDNIVFCASFTENSSGYVTKSYSDHRLLWAELNWN